MITISSVRVPSLRLGFVDETVRFADLRKYVVAFADAIHQNPKSICPHHQMILPRIIKG